MELEKLKDARSEPICKVCGQTQAQHWGPAGSALHPFEADVEVNPESQTTAAIDTTGRDMTPADVAELQKKVEALKKPPLPAADQPRPNDPPLGTTEPPKEEQP